MEDLICVFFAILISAPVNLINCFLRTLTPFVVLLSNLVLIQWPKPKQTFIHTKVNIEFLFFTKISYSWTRMAPNEWETFWKGEKDYLDFNHCMFNQRNCLEFILIHPWMVSNCCWCKFCWHEDLWWLDIRLRSCKHKVFDVWIECLEFKPPSYSSLPQHDEELEHDSIRYLHWR